MSLLYAIRYNNFDLFQTLLEQKDCNLNETDNLFNTPLHIAVMLNNVEMVKLILEKNVNVNAINYLGYTSLHYTLIKEEIYLKKINDQFDQKYQSKNIIIMEMLLKSGADINCPSYPGLTSLEFACSYGLLESIELLLNCGAEVNESIFKISSQKVKRFINWYFIRKNIWALWELD